MKLKERRTAMMINVPSDCSGVVGVSFLDLFLYYFTAFSAMVAVIVVFFIIVVILDHFKN